jgi:ABC-type sugar transport system ATPase subunit
MNFLRGRVRESDGLALETADLTLPTPPLPAPRGREVVAGLRPEDLHRVDASGATQGIRLDATVELIESIGNEAYLHMKSGSTPLVARTSPYGLPAIGDRIRLQVPPDRVHFFDAARGERIEANVERG